MTLLVVKKLQRRW